MKLIKHAEIDKGKWDLLVENSASPSLYLLSWYLDATCHWDAIVWGDFKAAMPLPIKRFLFFEKIYQPVFVQKTGICSPKDLNGNKLLEELFNSNLLDRYCAMRIHFQASIPVPRNILKKNWKIELKILKLPPQYLY